jgi:hypothetical protein
MKKESRADPDMEAEYDFSKAVRGAFAERFPRGTTFVALDPDLCDSFPDSASVNDALRLVKVIRSHLAEKRAARPHKRAKSKAHAL